MLGFDAPVKTELKVNVAQLPDIIIK